MNRRALKYNLLFVSLLFLILIISFFDIVFLGKTFKVTTANPQALQSGPYGQEKNRPAFFPIQSSDNSLMEEPIYEFIKQSLRKGIFPFWNPHQGCGYPLIAMMEVAMFFPLSFILYLLPQLYGWDVMILSRFLLSGLFTYWLMRTLRYGRTASLGSAIAFMLSGPMVLVQYWFTNVEILAPLILLSLERLVQQRSWQNCCFAAVAVALTFLGGHPEHVFFVNSLGFLFFCFRLFSVRPRCPKTKTVSRLFVAYLLGIGLSAFVSIPFLQNFSTELWHTHSSNVTAMEPGAANSEEIITMAIPHFFQKEPATFDFVRRGWWGGYLGIFPLGLAFLGLFGKQRRGLNYFLLLMALVNISFTYFKFGFISWIGYLPLLRYCRFYLHTVHLFALCIAILAGMGIRVFLIKKNMFKKGLGFSLPLLVIVGLYLFCFRRADHFALSLQSSILGLGVLVIFQLILFLKDKKYLNAKLSAAILVFCLSLELFLYIPRERARRLNSFPKVPYIEFLKSVPERPRAYGVFWTFYPNTASAYQVDDLGIFISLLPKRFVEFVNHFVIKDYFKKDLARCALQAVPVTLMAGSRPYLDLLNVRYTVAPSEMERMFPASRRPDFLKPFYNYEVKMYEHPGALPRTFIVHKAIFEPDENLAFEKIEKINKLFPVAVVIGHHSVPEIERQLNDAPLVDDSSARIVRYTPNEVVVEADVKNPGFLILGDSFHPDWKVFVDGKKSKIYIADYLLRAVFLPVGQHVVRFNFRPTSFYAGCFVSLFSLFVLLILLQKKHSF